MPAIRKALLVLNGIQSRDLVRDQNGVPVYAPSIASLAIGGFRSGGAAVEHVRKRLSSVLGVHEEQLFTEKERHGKGRGPAARDAAG